MQKQINSNPDYDRHPLGKAAVEGFSDEDKEKIKDIRSVIPADVHGLIELLFKDNKLQGIAIQGDPAIAVYNQLQEKLGLPLSTHKHGASLSISFTGDELNAIINGATSTIPREEITHASLARRSSPKPIPEGITSIPITQALSAAMPAKEKDIVEKIIAFIPENLRGAFTFEIERADNESKLIRLTFDPQTSLDIFAQTKGMFRHRHKQSDPFDEKLLFNKDKLEALASKLPAPCRERT